MIIALIMLAADIVDELASLDARKHGRERRFIPWEFRIVEVGVTLAKNVQMHREFTELGVAFQLVVNRRPGPGLQGDVNLERAKARAAPGKMKLPRSQRIPIQNDFLRRLAIGHTTLSPA